MCMGLVGWLVWGGGDADNNGAFRYECWIFLGAGKERRRDRLILYGTDLDVFVLRAEIESADGNQDGSLGIGCKERILEIGRFDLLVISRILKEYGLRPFSLLATQLHFLQRVSVPPISLWPTFLPRLSFKSLHLDVAPCHGRLPGPTYHSPQAAVTTASAVRLLLC